jgi:hypothetical protein
MTRRQSTDRQTAKARVLAERSDRRREPDGELLHVMRNRAQRVRLLGVKPEGMSS